MRDRWTLLHSLLCLALVPIFVAVHDTLQFLWLSTFALMGVTLSFFALLIREHAPFRAADRITMARILLTLSVVAVFWIEPSATWLSFTLAALAAASDFIDGYLARRHGPTARGAKLDMEADAFLMLVLSLCAYRFAEVFAAVLIPGIVRYAYVLVEAWRGKAQPESSPRFEAKLICAVSVTLLVASIAPGLPGLLTGLMGTAAAGLILYSFSRDFRSLRWR
ncbi:MAG: CDP-alcohol phosphatidyltransferase family protein [Bdellovibrionales bacterium]|nr:CDP-alcohol phosphatidyltransferase family protein [Bdellovibrionales bacterium]